MQPAEKLAIWYLEHKWKGVVLILTGGLWHTQKGH